MHILKQNCVSQEESILVSETVYRVLNRVALIGYIPQLVRTYMITFLPRSESPFPWVNWFFDGILQGNITETQQRRGDSDKPIQLSITQSWHRSGGVSEIPNSLQIILPLLGSFCDYLMQFLFLPVNSCYIKRFFQGRR